ncbi:MAG: hypothetical protein F6K38_38345 [Moorea sp. SIO3B2]|uniref:hypothetical protein n=1 Tax=Moorena sp. SIO4E2 TaxID=2607826 RepID=UPI0013C7EB55|nr:hypothetical protein [Moorena sp. SIO4E2]NEP37058.1 hypothetical protein [Moorena sp. SIO3B2]
MGMFAWNWHVCVELASCQFHAYFRAGRMPTPLIFIRRLSNAYEFIFIALTLADMLGNGYPSN